MLSKCCLVLADVCIGLSIEELFASLVPSRRGKVRLVSESRTRAPLLTSGASAPWRPS